MALAGWPERNVGAARFRCAAPRARQADGSSAPPPARQPRPVFRRQREGAIDARSATAGDAPGAARRRVSTSRRGQQVRAGFARVLR